MVSPKRAWLIGAIYHITNRGNHQEIIFREAIDYVMYLKILNETLDFYKDDNYEIISYCLMSNHVHILLKTGTKDPSHFMRRVNSIYAKYFNNKYSLIGHLFQGRYFSNLITNVMELVEVSRYIHLNPVRAKIVKRPEEYQWSSYNKIIISDIIDYELSNIEASHINNKAKSKDFSGVNIKLAENEILSLFDIYTIVEESNKDNLRKRALELVNSSKTKYKQYVEEKL